MLILHTTTTTDNLTGPGHASNCYHKVDGNNIQPKSMTWEISPNNSVGLYTEHGSRSRLLLLLLLLLRLLHTCVGNATEDQVSRPWVGENRKKESLEVVLQSCLGAADGWGKQQPGPVVSSAELVLFLTLSITKVMPSRLWTPRVSCSSRMMGGGVAV